MTDSSLKCISKSWHIHSKLFTAPLGKFTTLFTTLFTTWFPPITKLFTTVFIDEYSRVFHTRFQKVFHRCLYCNHEVSTPSFRSFSPTAVVASDTLCPNGSDRPLRHSVSDGVLHVILQNPVCLHVLLNLKKGVMLKPCRIIVDNCVS